MIFWSYANRVGHHRRGRICEQVTGRHGREVATRIQTDNNLRLHLRCFRRYWLMIAFERGYDRMPGEDRALHTGRKFVHAGKYGEFAHVRFDAAGCHHVVDLVEQALHFGFGFAFDAFGQQRGRRFGDTTAGADETDFFDRLTVHGQEEFQLITA